MTKRNNTIKDIDREKKTMNTHVCGDGSAWKEASRYWCCDGTFHDYACSFCLPCQLGVIKSKKGSKMDCRCPNAWCPTTSEGWTACTLTSCTLCCPLIYLLTTSMFIDGEGDEGLCNACLWLCLAPCTCSHCAVAAYAKKSATHGESLETLMVK